MPFLLRICACADSNLATCNKVIKEGNGVGDDRIRMLVEHMYQGTLDAHDVQTSDNRFAKEEMNRWTFREISLWICEWNVHYSNPDTHPQEQVPLEYLDRLDCGTRNKCIATPAFGRHNKVKGLIPVLRGLLPEPASQHQLEAAINTLSEEPEALEAEYRFLAAAERKPMKAGDLEGMKQEMRRWVIDRDLRRARAKIVSKMRGQLLLYGLFDYANQLRDTRLNADGDAGNEEDISDEDDGFDELLMELDQIQEETPISHTPQEDPKGEHEASSAWWHACGCGFPAPGDMSTDIDDEFEATVTGATQNGPSLAAQIAASKRLEYEDQGEWKEHMTHDGKTYYYLVRKEENEDGVVEQFPTGNVRWDRPPDAKPRVVSSFENWEELACSIGTRSSCGLGVLDTMVQHIFHKFQQDDKLAYLKDLRPGLAHLLCAGFGPSHKLRVAFELSTMPAIHQVDRAADRNNLTCGPSEWLTESQFVNMYKSLHAYTEKFPNFTATDRKPRASKQVAKDGARLFRQINNGCDNKYVTFEMIHRYAVKYPKMFWEIGIHIGAAGADYNVAKGKSFMVHSNGDVAVVIQVLDAVAAVQRHREAITQTFSKEQQMGTIVLDPSMMESSETPKSTTGRQKASGALNEDMLSDLDDNMFTEPPDCRFLIHKMFYTDQILAAFHEFEDGSSLVDHYLPGNHQDFKEGDLLMGRLMFSPAALRSQIWTDLDRGGAEEFRYNLTTSAGVRKLTIITITEKERDNLLEMFEDYAAHMLSHAKQDLVPTDDESPRRDSITTLLPVILGFYEIQYDGMPSVPFIVTRDNLSVLSALSLTREAKLVMSARAAAAGAGPLPSTIMITGSAITSQMQGEARFKPYTGQDGRTEPISNLDPIMTQLQSDADFLVKAKIVGWGIEVGVNSQLETNRMVAELELSAVRHMEAKLDLPLADKPYAWLLAKFSKEDLIEWNCENTECSLDDMFDSDEEGQHTQHSTTHSPPTSTRRHTLQSTQHSTRNHSGIVVYRCRRDQCKEGERPTSLPIDGSRHATQLCQD